MNYIAHINNKGKIQTVKEHSENTAALSEAFAIKELKDICNTLGMLHDIGKYQLSFQKRILGDQIHVEHSICGAQVAIEHYGDNPLGLLLALCVAGHHSGIPDCGGKIDIAEATTLYGRIKRSCEDYSTYKDELSLPQLNSQELNALLMAHCRTKEELIESYAFLTRYCFSCLTDGDTLDTMNASGTPASPPLTADFVSCINKLNNQFDAFEPVTQLQKARARLQNQAFENIKDNAEIYLMGMPTGSGKTLASLKCALMRAVQTGKRRIIYVIPYNSIIDQTAEVFEQLLGDSARILRHQSTFEYEDREDIDEDYRRSAVYACENWDAQLIITTAVQFFESVYANRRGKLRKLHNMADSVLVFDEAHTMPLAFLQPCLRAIAFITKYLHSEAIFLTATMPDFKSLIREYALKDSDIKDLIPDHSDFIFFKKNEYINIGSVSDEKLLHISSKFTSSLIVVNSRRTALKLYNTCKGCKFHLSTYMTAFDRTRVITRIRKEIKKLHEDYPGLINVPPDRRITVISTSLIEAGVDLDFTAAFRELNGLDNVLQTGGRCNREGFLEKGCVYIFEREDSPRAFSVQQSILNGILCDYKDISSDEAILEYYRRLLNVEQDSITRNSLSSLCSSIDSIPFRTYSEKLHLIDSGTVSVAVGRDTLSRTLIHNARYTGILNTRKIQNYCCSVYPYEAEELLKQHAVEELNGVFVVTNMDYYNIETGIQFDGKDFII